MNQKQSEKENKKMRKERNEKQTAANEMASVQETSTTATQYVEQKDAEREQTLVSEINLITEQTKQALLTGTIEIGKRLTEAKCLMLFSFDDFTIRNNILPLLPMIK